MPRKILRTPGKMGLRCLKAGSRNYFHPLSSAWRRRMETRGDSGWADPPSAHKMQIKLHQINKFESSLWCS